jgi:hypothetical protein
MTVMLLALLMSDSALNASDIRAYRITEESTGESRETQARERARAWKPGVDRWMIEKVECPAFFKDQIEGFGNLQVGPRCDADLEVPYAL